MLTEFPCVLVSQATYRLTFGDSGGMTLLRELLWNQSSNEMILCGTSGARTVGETCADIGGE